MRVYGYTITHKDDTDTLIHVTPEGALHLCAEWCRQNWTATERSYEACDEDEMIKRWKDTHPREQITAFDAQVDVNDLREAYCAAIGVGYDGYLLNGNPNWINEQMKALSDALPSGWTIYSDEEIAGMTDLTGGDPLHVL